MSRVVNPLSVSKNQKMGPPIIGKQQLRHQSRQAYTQPETINEKIFVKEDQKNGKGSGPYFSGTEGKSSHFRSNQRINKLMGIAISSKEQDQRQLSAQSKHENNRQKALTRSTNTENSSATTASTLKGVHSSKTTQKNDGASRSANTDSDTSPVPRGETSQFSLNPIKKKKGTVAEFDLKLTGKRQSGTDIASLELESKLRNSSLLLRQKGTNNMKRFQIFDEDRLAGIATVQQFDMRKLETEYDYETDKEQISQSVNMLQCDLKDAICFFVQQDPLILIENCNKLGQVI